VGLWRALAHPRPDLVLWGLCLLAAALAAWPAARSLLGTEALRWRWADGLWAPRAVRLAAALLGLLAGLRLLAAALPAWAPPPRRPRHTGEFTLAAADASEALAQVQAALGATGLAVGQRVEREGVWLLTVWRRGWARWTATLAPLGLLLLLAGGLLQSALGWGSDPAPLLPEQRIALGPRTALQAEVQAADAASARSIITLWEGDRPAGAVRLGRWQPAYFQGLLLRQVGDGPALRLSVSDASGAAAALLPLTEGQSAEAFVYLRFSAEQQEQQVALPSANLALRLVHYYPQGIALEDSRGDFHAEALSGRDGRVLERITFAHETVWEVGGLRVTLIPTRYLVLRVSHLAGWPLALVGLALGLAGLLTPRWLPAPRLWLALAGEEGRWRGQVAATSAALLEQMLALLASSSACTS